MHLGEIDAREVNSIPLGTDADGREIVVRVGRYGPYLQRGEDRAAVPDDLAPDELTLERAAELLENPSSDRVLGNDPVTGKPVLRSSRTFRALRPARRGRRRRRKAADGVVVQDHDRVGHHPRAGPAASRAPADGGRRPRDG